MNPGDGSLITVIAVVRLNVKEPISAFQEAARLEVASVQRRADRSHTVRLSCWVISPVTDEPRECCPGRGSALEARKRA